MEKMTDLSGDDGEQRWRQRHIEVETTADGGERWSTTAVNGSSQRENVCPSLIEDVKNRQQKCLPASD
ncbi:hypothetical protein Tco_0330010 [Tanacetum coccineum]